MSSGSKMRYYADESKDPNAVMVYQNTPQSIANLTPLDMNVRNSKDSFNPIPRKDPLEERKNQPVAQSAAQPMFSSHRQGMDHSPERTVLDPS